MAFFPRLVCLKPYFNHRQFSAIAKPDSEANKQRIRIALSLLETKNKNKAISSAEQILYLALSDAVSIFSHTESSSDMIPSFLHELKTQPSLLCSLLDELKSRPDLRKEPFFSYFITLYGQSGMFDRAIQTFKYMATVKIAPSTESLTVLLRSGLYKNTGISEVLKVFNELSDTYDIKPDVETYSILLEGFVPLGYFIHREAICSLLEQMDNEGIFPNDTTSSIVMNGLHKEKPEYAAQVIMYVVDRVLPLLDARVYNFGIESLCKLKKEREALDLFETLTSQAPMSMQPNTDMYQLLINLCCEKRHLGKLVHLQKTIRDNMDPETYKSCYEILIKTLCEYGYYLTAYTAIEDCISEIWCADAFLPGNLTTIKLLIGGPVPPLKYYIGMQLNRLMEKNSLKADLEFYNCSIECMCQRGSLVEAKAVLEGLEAKDLKPDCTTYRHMISAFSKKGDTEQVRALYFDMNDKGVEPDRYCYETILKCLFQSGDSDSALQVCKHCMTKEWFEDFFHLSDCSTMKRLLSLVTRIAKFQKTSQIGRDESKV